jgi:N-acetylglucosaminyl-diphospho-decaprenol L-rhamnosyltransferase
MAKSSGTAHDLAPRIGSSGDRTALSCTIIITHYRSVDALTACLRSVAPLAGKAEIIVSDSQALPTTSEVVASVLPEAGYLGFAENVGYAALVNAAMLEAAAPFYFVLNADVQVSPTALEELIDIMHQEPRLGILAPRLRNPDGSVQQSTFAFYRPLTTLYRRTALGRTSAGRKELARFCAPSAEFLNYSDLTTMYVDWVLGAAMLVRHEAVSSVGFLDESYFLYFEDVDWSYRMWQAGWRVGITNKAECHHVHARASAGNGPLGPISNRLTRVHIRSAIRFFLKHGVRPARSTNESTSRRDQSRELNR